MCTIPFKQARRYAQAFLNVFAKIPTPELLQNLENLIEFLHQNPIIFSRLASRITDETIKEQSFYIITDAFNLGSQGKKLITVLLQHKKIKLLPQILNFCVTEGRNRRHEFLCEVATSHDLSQTSKESLRKILNEKLGGTIIPTYRKEPSLINGIRVTGRTFVWEHSIAKKLRNCMAFIARQE